MALINVQGECPMGCGSRLHLNTGTGMILCVNKDCPRATAVSDLLRDPPIDHKVEVDVFGFGIKHPLHERIADKLFECDLQTWLADLDGPPVSGGTYRVRKIDQNVSYSLGESDAQIDGWLFEKVEGQL